MTRSTRRSRRGWTLIEMLVVISIMSVLLASVAVLTQTLFRQHRSFGRGLAQQRGLVLLARQIRSDIHAATQVTTAPTQNEGAQQQAGTIRCTWPEGRSVSYQQQDGRLLRVVREPGDEAGNRQPFTLPPGARVRLVTPDDSDLPIAAVRIDYDPQGREATVNETSKAATRTLVIEALIGRDLRWQEAEEQP